MRGAEGGRVEKEEKSRSKKTKQEKETNALVRDRGPVAPSVFLHAELEGLATRRGPVHGGRGGGLGLGDLALDELAAASSSSNFIDGSSDSLLGGVLEGTRLPNALLDRPLAAGRDEAVGDVVGVGFFFSRVEG